MKGAFLPLPVCLHGVYGDTFTFNFLLRQQFVSRCVLRCSPALWAIHWRSGQTETFPVFCAIFTRCCLHFGTEPKMPTARCVVGAVADSRTAILVKSAHEGPVDGVKEIT